MQNMVIMCLISNKQPISY